MTSVLSKMESHWRVFNRGVTRIYLSFKRIFSVPGLRINRDGGGSRDTTYLAVAMMYKRENGNVDQSDSCRNSGKGPTWLCCESQISRIYDRVDEEWERRGF